MDGLTLAEEIDRWSILSPNCTEEARKTFRVAPCGRFNIELGSQKMYYDNYDMDRAEGCIRDVAHAYTKDGGLAVLFGNIALDGCIVKTAGVDESIFHFEGPARVFDSQEAACEGILGGKVGSGDVVVITYEGPKGGPGMQEMLYPTSYIKSMHLGKECALLTPVTSSDRSPVDPHERRKKLNPDRLEAFFNLIFLLHDRHTLVADLTKIVEVLLLEDPLRILSVTVPAEDAAVFLDRLRLHGVTTLLAHLAHESLLGSLPLLDAAAREFVVVEFSGVHHQHLTVTLNDRAGGRAPEDRTVRIIVVCINGKQFFHSRNPFLLVRDFPSPRSLLADSESALSILSC